MHGMKANVHARALRRMTREGSRGENKGDDLTSARGDVDEGREVRWTKADKALYAQPNEGVKELEHWVLQREKTAYAQHDQRICVCSRPHEIRLFTHSMAHKAAYAQHDQHI